MFVYDIETLGRESLSVVLSIAILHVNESNDYSQSELFERTLFVKFSVKEQVEQYKRLVDRDTIDWWKKQCTIAKNQSFVQKSTDLSIDAGLDAVETYINQHKKAENELVFVRGNLDQLCLDSLCRNTKRQPLFDFYNYRDIRTAVDLLHSSANKGYCSIDTSRVDYDASAIIKHDPVCDVVLDTLMLMYGV